jgi:uncharacterized protein YraI
MKLIGVSRAAVIVRMMLVPIMLAVALAVPLIAQASDMARVQIDLNLRTGPGLEYAVIAVMPVGSEVALTGEERDGWYSVIYDGLAGWAIGDGLAAAPAPATPDPAPSLEPVAAPSAAPSPLPSPPTGAPAARATIGVEQGLNVRDLPGLDSTVIAVLPFGTPVAIVGESETVDGYTWVQIVTAADVQGWVVADFLIPDVVPAPAPGA